MAHWAPGTHTSTFMGDAVNLAAGLAAIGVLRDEGLVERSATVGARLLEQLRAALADDAHVGEVRGLGLFVGIEIVADRDDRTRRPGSHRRGSGVPRSNGACCSARAATTRTSSSCARR